MDHQQLPANVKTRIMGKLDLKWHLLKTQWIQRIQRPARTLSTSSAVFQQVVPPPAQCLFSNWVRYTLLPLRPQGQWFRPRTLVLGTWASLSFRKRSTLFGLWGSADRRLCGSRPRAGSRRICSYELASCSPRRGHLLCLPIRMLTHMNLWFRSWIEHHESYQLRRWVQKFQARSTKFFRILVYPNWILLSTSCFFPWGHP